MNDKQMFLLFNHKLTDSQKQDAVNNLNVIKFIYLPDNLQAMWSQVPAELNTDELETFLQPIKNWLIENHSKDDIALIQGDFGATYKIVKFCNSLNIKAVHSTNQRVAKEIHDGNKVHVSHTFEHVRFRKF